MKTIAKEILKVTFTEFTFINEDQEEIMIDVNPSGDIIDIYTYEYCQLSVLDSETDKELKIRNDNWEVIGNDLFVHCPKSQAQFKKVVNKINRSGFVLCLEPDETEELDLFFDMLNKYGIDKQNFFN